LISHLFTVCVPYARPQPTYLSLEDLVKNGASNFTYQLQFASGDLEKVIRSKSDIKQFLSALYGGRTEKGEIGLHAEKGVLWDKISALKVSRLLSEEVSFLCWSTLLDATKADDIQGVGLLRDRVL
jgi:hypothetical protein